MNEITDLAVLQAFLGEPIFVSRGCRDVAGSNRNGQATAGYREYAASSAQHPAFVIRVEVLKNAPQPTKRQKVKVINPRLFYITERNANRRSVDVPIILAEAVEFID
jgi:hypothetical protein